MLRVSASECHVHSTAQPRAPPIMMTMMVVEGKIGLACGMCLGLAGLSMVERASATILRADEYRAHSRQEKSMFAALPTKDEKWIEAWKDRINELK